MTAEKTTATPDIKAWFRHGFEDACGASEDFERRIGAELKFPLVQEDGACVPRETVDALWQYLIEDHGWTGVTDSGTGRTVGASCPGPRNDTVASCETGYAKTEFSLAHTGDLHELAAQIEKLRPLLHGFSSGRAARFLAYGIHPVSEPGRALLMKKERASFWDRAMPSNHRIPPEKGDDVHLFTVNAGSHVHLSVRPAEAVRAVNVLNGLAGAQIALMGDSSVWQGKPSRSFKCTSEVLWDFWRAAEGRAGLPPRRFADLDDYVEAITALRPIYVRRNNQPVLLRGVDRFIDYWESGQATGETLDGETLSLTPEMADLELHNSCYWYVARISRYWTVENRACDQQPPEALLTPAALTLGLIEAAGEAIGLVDRFDWDALVRMRRVACEAGLAGQVGGTSLRALAGQMLSIAQRGLEQRGRGEERYLAPLHARIEKGHTPADDALSCFAEGGMQGLLAARTL